MSPTILLIHWDWAEAQALTAELEGAGFGVIAEAEDGSRAVGMAVNHPPYAVVISLRRSAAHGIEVARALTEHPATVEVPVLLFDGAARTVKKAGRLVPETPHVPWEEIPGALAGLHGRPD
jgi:DNA-binding NarL/FixJ family response regulator